jgi:hypothetical protein
MNSKVKTPESYPDFNARNPDRNLSKLLREKYYYYGGNTLNPSSEQAAGLAKTKFGKVVISDLIILTSKQELSAQTIFDNATRIIVNIYSLNPHILAVALHIINVIDPRNLDSMKTPEFKRSFEALFNEAWNSLYTQLSKIQTKKNSSKVVSQALQMSDVIRYIQTYLIHKT